MTHPSCIEHQGAWYVCISCSSTGASLKEQSIIFSLYYSILNGQHDYERAIDRVAEDGLPRCPFHKSYASLWLPGNAAILAAS